ncbi:hypothetical protein MBLNU230_g4000t1 [Neophaeotheca triangularis]
MSKSEEIQTANVNRAIRTIKAELEYLTDCSIITPQALSDLLQRIPQQTALHAPISVGAVPTSAQQAGVLQPPTSPMANMNLNQSRGGPTHSNSYNSQSNGYQNEKSTPQQSYYQPSPSPQPPAYQPPPGPPPQAQWQQPQGLAQATALYAYNSTDAGDLPLQPNDQITVTEYMNAEWWKGRSSRTGQEGIFPRSYVKVVDTKSAPHNSGPASYGNMPMAVAQGQPGQAPPQDPNNPEGENKIEGHAKKFGGKLGNAAIFGAGATLGGNLVNSIF